MHTHTWISIKHAHSHSHTPYSPCTFTSINYEICTKKLQLLSRLCYSPATPPYFGLVPLFVLLINNPSELCIRVWLCAHTCTLWLLCVYVTNSHIRLQLHAPVCTDFARCPRSLPPATLLFTICFLLNCSFVLTCKFLNFHHSFSFAFFFPVHLLWHATPATATSAALAALFTAFVCISKCVKCIPHCEAVWWVEGEERKEGGVLAMGVAWALWSCPSQLISAAWLSVFYFLCIKM